MDDKPVGALVIFFIALVFYIFAFEAVALYFDERPLR